MNKSLIAFTMIPLLLCTACTTKQKEGELIIKEVEEEKKIIEEIETDEKIIEEIDEPVQEEPKETVPDLTEQEKARFELIDKHGIEVVEAWEALSIDPFFDYIGYELVVIEDYDPLSHEVYYHCYKVMEDGSLQDAYVGGNYYVYGVFVSTEAIYDLVEYHNQFIANK